MPRLSRLGQRLRVARFEFVIRRVAGDDRPLVSRNRLRDTVGGDVGAEDFLELRLVAVDAVQLLDDRIERHVHLNRILNRAESLILQGLHATVPELQRAIRRVDDRRGRAAALLTFDSGGEAVAVGKAFGRIVAARAAHFIVGRQPAIEIKLLAKSNLLGRHRVVARHGDRRQAERRGRFLGGDRNAHEQGGQDAPKQTETSRRELHGVTPSGGSDINPLHHVCKLCEFDLIRLDPLFCLGNDTIQTTEAQSSGRRLFSSVSLC